MHDAFTAFYPVTEKNVEIAQKTNEAENKDDCVVFSKVNIKPYSHQDHRGENKIKVRNVEEFDANANFK